MNFPIIAPAPSSSCSVLLRYSNLTLPVVPSLPLSMYLSLSLSFLPSHSFFHSSSLVLRYTIPHSSHIPCSSISSVISLFIFHSIFPSLHIPRPLLPHCSRHSSIFHRPLPVALPAPEKDQKLTHSPRAESVCLILLSPERRRSFCRQETLGHKGESLLGV